MNRKAIRLGSLLTLVVLVIAILAGRLLRDEPGEAPLPSRSLRDDPGTRLAPPVAGIEGSSRSRDPSLLRIDGELRLYDWDGTLIDVPRGYLVCRANGTDPFPAWLKGGRWAADVEPGVLAVERIAIDGYVAVPRERQYVTESSKTLVIEADVEAGTGLRVVDVEDGAELSGITVVAVRDSQYLGLSVPPEEALTAPTVEQATSPVSVPAQQESWDFWVGVPSEYAWRSITIVRSDRGRTRTVTLPKSGALEVQLGSAGDAALSLVLRSAARPVDDYARCPVGPGGSVTIDGLVPGTYFARLQGEEGQVRQERRVSISAGWTTQVQWEAPGSSSGIQGTLSWPEANSGIAPQPILYRIGLDGAWEAVDRQGAVWRVGSMYGWSLGEHPPGEYAVVIQPIQQEALISVSEAEPDRSWALEGVEASRVTLHPAPEHGPGVQDLYWSRLPALFSEASRTEEGSFTFSCAPGRIRVVAVGVEQELEVGSGPNDFVLEAPGPGPTSEVTLRFMENGVTIPVEVDLFAPDKIGETVSGGGRYVGPLGEISGLASRFAALRLQFSAPGVYVFRLPQFMGYRPLEPLRIEVGDHRRAGVVEVELEPEH